MRTEMVENIVWRAPSNFHRVSMGSWIIPNSPILYNKGLRFSRDTSVDVTLLVLCSLSLLMEYNAAWRHTTSRYILNSLKTSGIFFYLISLSWCINYFDIKYTEYDINYILNTLRCITISHQELNKKWIAINTGNFVEMITWIRREEYDGLNDRLRLSTWQPAYDIAISLCQDVLLSLNINYYCLLDTVLIYIFIAWHVR